jgi:hypothetical protein
MVAEHRKNSDAERVAVEGDDRGKVSHPDSDHSYSDDILRAGNASHCLRVVDTIKVCLWNLPASASI